MRSFSLSAAAPLIALSATTFSQLAVAHSSTSSSAVSSTTFDCTNIDVGGTQFDLHKLGGRHSVHWVQVNPPGRPGTHNLTFTLDLCQPLQLDKSVESEYQCPSGTRVCAVDKTYYDTGHFDITHVLPIAGDFDERQDTLRPHWSQLKEEKDSSSDDGLRLDFYGGHDPAGESELSQMAVIDFVCDLEIEGDDVDAPSAPDHKDDDKKDDKKDGHSRRRLRYRSDDEKPDPEPASPDAGLDTGRSLQFVSYKKETDEPAVQILRLKWKTKHVCSKSRNEPVDDSSSWGFFTWLLIIVFLSIAAYIIFGAIGRSDTLPWTQMPSADGIAELPSAIKELVRNVIDSFNAPPRRGHDTV